MSGSSDQRRVQAYYEDFSPRYERGRFSGYHALVDELETSVVLPFARGARVLEVGCGTGLVLGRVAPHAKEAIGVDLTHAMVRKAARRGLKVTQGTVAALPFHSGSFDLTYALKVLPHVADVRGALGEMARVTRPGGVVVAEFYNRWSLRYWVKRLSGPRPVGDRSTEADILTRWDTPRTIAGFVGAELELVGFRGVRVVTVAASLHRLPVLGRALGRMERAVVASPLRYTGGFLLAILRKRK